MSALAGEASARRFLPRRHDVAQSLDRIGEHLRGTGDPKRLIDEVASTLELASVAVLVLDVRSPAAGRQTVAPVRVFFSYSKKIKNDR